MKVLIIIPAYNEQDNIICTIKDIQKYTQGVDYIVINDCSTDRTKEILQQQGIPHLDLPINLGIGGCVQTGYHYALACGYDIAIQFDGDGQHMAQYIDSLIAPILEGQADVVIGSRFIAREGFQSTKLRRFGIGFLSSLIRFLCGVHVLDVTSGFRAVGGRMLKLYATEYAQDYPEPEAIIAAGLNGGIIKEVPVQMRERQMGTSSINSLRSVYYMIKVSLALVLARITYTRSK